VLEGCHKGRHSVDPLSAAAAAPLTMAPKGTAMENDRCESATMARYGVRSTGGVQLMTAVVRALEHEGVREHG
jgi:hypothetical protein